MTLSTMLGSPINVAQVKKLSPFRYPGGKTWLIPYIRAWLAEKRCRELVEPFAGGGIVGLTAAIEGLTERVTLVEMDSSVAAVWKTILSPRGGGEWLAKRILAFDLTPATVNEVLSAKPQGIREKAFATIIKNRCQRGGIMANGAGLIKFGEKGRGLLSRWYPKTLAERIRTIAHFRSKIDFIEGDAFSVIRQRSSEPDVSFFIDPPYTIAARRLYSHWEVDHVELFALAKQIRGDFLMTYDKTEEIERLSKRFGFRERPITMKNTHHAVMDELLIGRNLCWLDSEVAKANPSLGVLLA